MVKSPKSFRPAGAPTRQQQRQRADDRRGSAANRGYNRRWSKARDTFLAHRPLCLGCEAVGKVTAARVVDHVDPHHGDPEKFWNTAMWQPCCKWHHDHVKQRLEVMYERGQIGIESLWLNSDRARAITLGLMAGLAEEAGGGSGS
ncbi:HNH endonuclease [Martelella lutilitoris]|uniref:HNH endonuclease n=1 Tax=Martelella lutilitoris TaxID=2583532 RepID=A0A5C4JND7_9HYPH|nr:HNH endonuclease [Martelella lutilitoris]TNB46820.1 HNH endonuclease [Martelella lutilitoris]